MKERIAFGWLCLALLLIAAVALYPVAAQAVAPSGAIFTTLSDGSEVNLNQFPAKEDVYLDGGPGPGAPQTAAGLDDGIYVLQVTDPSGKVLLSSDLAGCRQFEVVDGIIVGVVPYDSCAHNTGLDIDHGAATVQLFPYNDTPNKGGVYKVWVTLVEDYLEGCALQGVMDGLNVVDCGPFDRRSGGVAHGFIPAESKTDNFKVGEGPPQEIDVRFFDDATGELIDQLEVVWIDTHGASNKKWSVWAPWLSAYHEAHVENVEIGNHLFEIYDQAGCAVQEVRVDGQWMPEPGPQTVDVSVKQNIKNKPWGTIWVDVFCITSP
ncbi:MAG: hypothetical protein Kow0025_25350 [Thermodesulfovibrionales bacterium]